MNRTMLNVFALTFVAAAGSISAQNRDFDRNGGHDNIRSDHAVVVDVQRVGGRHSSRLSQECWNERTSRNEPGYYRDNSGRLYRGENNDKSGTIIGAIIGGALGNQVGKGDGRKAATIAGAVIGGSIGSKHNDRDGYRNDYRNDGYQDYQGDGGNVVRCRTISEPTGGYGRRGYMVTYDYAGQNYQAFTTVRPGRTIPVIVDVRPQ